MRTSYVFILFVYDVLDIAAVFLDLVCHQYAFDPTADCQNAQLAVLRVHPGDILIDVVA